MPVQLLFDLLKGVAVGIVIALPVGPVGVLCVRRTLFEGPSYGFVSGLGAATADTVFGIIAGFGLTFVRDLLLGYQDWLGAAGGIFLIAVGIKALTTRGDIEPEPVEDEALFAAYASTFALTITNPITILAFAGIFAKVGVSESAGFLDTGVLVGGTELRHRRPATRGGGGASCLAQSHFRGDPHALRLGPSHCGRPHLRRY